MYNNLEWIFVLMLEKINNTEDIKLLNKKGLESLAEDIRTEIKNATFLHGGHLSSNLGIVETTLSLYYTFDFPKDKLIFDVGHQCYTHKILSGRKDEFKSIREDEGISGFPNKEESEFDIFTTGHAGTSISTALGLCMARDKLNEDYVVVNVVGDGSIVNGLNLEAITSSNDKPKNLVVILNDNGMSISKNKNAFYKFISKSSISKSYVNNKRRFKKVFRNSIFTKFLRKVKNAVKKLFSRQNFFEKYGFKYVGVVDGNDIEELNKTLKMVKYACKQQAIFLHVSTVKGKGDKTAEEHADLYHGVSKDNKCSSTTYAKSLSDAINSLIESDSNVVAITAGMKDGTGLKAVEEKYPQNFYDVGIAEEFAVSLASGMATGGLKPIVVIYSTFLQRAYDQIIHDVCLQNLPIIFCVDRAGFVGADGQTHQGLFDISFLSHIPNLKILSINSPEEFSDALCYAKSLNCPVALRYPKSEQALEYSEKYDSGKWIKLLCRDNFDVAVFAVGANMISLALEFSKNCDKKVQVYAVRSIKPLDDQALTECVGKKIITLEENSKIGGFGSSVASYYAKNGNNIVYICGAEDKFIKHGKVKTQLKNNGLTIEELVDILK